MSRTLTDLEIQDRYVSFLRDKASRLDLYDGDEDSITSLSNPLNKGSMEWPHVNHLRFTFNSNVSIFKRDIEFFEDADVVWTAPCLSAEDDRLVLELLLVDYHEAN